MVAPGFKGELFDIYSTLYPYTLLSGPDYNLPSNRRLSDMEYFPEIDRYGSVPRRLRIHGRCP